MVTLPPPGAGHQAHCPARAVLISLKIFGCPQPDSAAIGDSGRSPSLCSRWAFPWGSGSESLDGRRKTNPRCASMRLDHSFSDEPEDARDGPWSREQLETMNAQFVAAMERAFELGLESRASAANQVKLPTSSGPRFVTPLPREIAEGLWRSSADALVMVAR